MLSSIVETKLMVKKTEEGGEWLQPDSNPQPLGP